MLNIGLSNQLRKPLLSNMGNPDQQVTLPHNRERLHKNQKTRKEIPGIRLPNSFPNFANVSF